MAETVTFIIALPAVYGIGLFYWRLGVWLCRAARQAFAASSGRSTHNGREAMQHDQRYEHALSAALVILGEIDKQPDMPKHNRLALAVFSILHAMDRWEEERGEKHVQFSIN